MEIDSNFLVSTALEAGKEILSIYQSDDFQIEYKKDNSPLTRADTASDNIIKKYLQKEFPHIPIISEEGKNITYEERKKWREFFLVDPLDGTKEFIKRNGEFTVNIAFIRDSLPVSGVVYAPALKTIYYATEKKGAFRQIEGCDPEPIQTQRREEQLVVVRSRSHSSSAEDEFFENFSIAETKSKGSSLKFCLVAEGSADIYFRAGPTWEWDTAAGHAVVRIAGGHVYTGDPKKKGTQLLYNKPSLKNDDGFICLSHKRLFSHSSSS